VAACLAVLAWVGATAQPAASQDVGALETTERLAVFLDCGFCDETFIRQEMAYVDYVRDREVADVHVLVTQENTGAGGEAHTFDLIGQGPFQGMDYSTVYTTNVDATEAEERDGFLRTLQATLVPYLLQTPVAERLTVGVEPLEGAETGQAAPRNDPWNNWTVEIYADGSAMPTWRRSCCDAVSSRPTTRPASASGCDTASARSTTTSSTRASAEEAGRIGSDPGRA
jgi:hypothetical protein